METDITMAVLHPEWIFLAVVALGAVIMMLFGFTAVYTKLFAESGLIGLLGFIFIELAYLLQACTVTWEIFLWPIIASHRESLFLLRDFVIKHDPLIGVFKVTASITIFLGIILFCIALVRSKSFPKVGGILIFVGAFMYGLAPLVSVIAAIVGIFILSIGCTIIGISMMRKSAGYRGT
jgi:hypothetical protein